MTVPTTDAERTTADAEGTSTDTDRTTAGEESTGEGSGSSSESTAGVAECGRGSVGDGEDCDDMVESVICNADCSTAMASPRPTGIQRRGVIAAAAPRRAGPSAGRDCGPSTRWVSRTRPPESGNALEETVVAVCRVMR